MDITEQATLDFEEEAYFTAFGMKKFGGSFVKSLGEALSRADGINRMSIKKAFPEYWEKYLKIGEKKLFKGDEINE